MRFFSQSIKKEIDAFFENFESKKPLQFYVANKYPFYIDKETLTSNVKEKNFMTFIDENLEKIKNYYNDSPAGQLIRE